jgi:hypothetical protein
MSIRLIVLALLCAGNVFGTPHITSVSECAVGGILIVHAVSNPRESGLEARLIDGSGGVFSKNLFFQVPGGAADRNVAILGVPDTMEPGSYLVAVARDGVGVVESLPVTITPYDFKTETIRFDRALTALHRTDEKRRIDEARVMWEITTKVNSLSVFHLAPFAAPFTIDRITSSFGDRRLYVYADSQTQATIHAGVDLAAPTGTPVEASGDGRVVLATERLLTGNTVVIEHLPGIYALYYHLDTIDVAPGELVTGKTVIGTVGASGLATGPHLHWEFRVGGVSVNPFEMMKISF